MAITARRSRAVPAGTVGGLIAWANTPRSIASWHSAIASRSSPTISGTICISPSGDREALQLELRAQRAGVVAQPAHALGLALEQLQRGQRTG